MVPMFEYGSVYHGSPLKDSVGDNKSVFYGRIWKCEKINQRLCYVIFCNENGLLNYGPQKNYNFFLLIIFFKKVREILRINSLVDQAT